jgi:hypothetical protein
MIGVGCFQLLLKVIDGLLCLTLKISLDSGDELLVRVTSILIVITFIVASGDCDLLGSLLWPALIASSAPLCTLVGCLGRRCPTVT